METAYVVLNSHVPVYTWPSFLLFFALSLSVILWWNQVNGCQEGWIRPVLRALLMTYLAAVLFTTLIARVAAPERRAKWMPLWSWYEVIVHHNKWLFVEIVLNVVLFMPIGFLIRRLYQVRLWHAFLLGFLLSAAIELTQLVTCRGLFEWDDMIGNGFGCMVGCIIGSAIRNRRKPDAGAGGG